MQRDLEIDGVRLHLSQPHSAESNWIGQTEILKQLLACWMVVIATVLNNPVNSLIGYAILAAGIPACLYWQRKDRAA